MDMAGESGNGPERAALYQMLAEALAPDEPPEWMAEEGRSWPLYNVVASLVHESPFARRAVVALEGVPSRPFERLKDSFSALFAGSFSPYYDLYESTWVSGRPMGPETFQVERVYRAAGLEIEGSELADHAAMELAFLAYLAGLNERELERNFIRKHAGRWLPSLGRRLSLSGYQEYAIIGSFLTGWLEEAVRSTNGTLKNQGSIPKHPSINIPEDCTLCGFCVQVCPTRSLRIQDTESETSLYLYHGSCSSCGRCQKACTFGVLHLEPMLNTVSLKENSRVILHFSKRETCTVCGFPMVSQAEMAYVRQELGNPIWLDYCQDCRSGVILEKRTKEKSI